MAQFGKLIGSFAVSPRRHLTQLTQPRRSILDPCPEATTQGNDQLPQTQQSIQPTSQQADAMRPQPNKASVPANKLTEFTQMNSDNNKLPSSESIHSYLHDNAEAIEPQDVEIAAQIKEQRALHPNEPIIVTNSGFNVKEAKTLSQATQELLRIKAVWPFDFFPNELVIEEKRIAVKVNHFYYTHTVSTLPIVSLKAFEVTTSILFSTIYIKGGELSEIDLSLKWFKPQDAQRAKELVDGLYMTEKGMFEVKESNPVERIEVLQKLGETSI